MIGGLRLNLVNDCKFLGHRCVAAHTFIMQDSEERAAEAADVAEPAPAELHAVCVGAPRALHRLGGITPNAVGMAQLIVTYKLMEDFTLRVTALDKQRNHSRQIMCRELR